MTTGHNLIIIWYLWPICLFPRAQFTPMASAWISNGWKWRSSTNRSGWALSTKIHHLWWIFLLLIVTPIALSSQQWSLVCGTSERSTASGINLVRRSTWLQAKEYGATGPRISSHDHVQQTPLPVTIVIKSSTVYVHQWFWSDFVRLWRFPELVSSSPSTPSATSAVHVRLSQRWPSSANFPLNILCHRTRYCAIAPGDEETLPEVHLQLGLLLLLPLPSHPRLTADWGYHWVSRLSIIMVNIFIIGYQDFHRQYQNHSVSW